MENVKFLFEHNLHFWEERYLSTISHRFSKKLYWWMVDDHSIFDFYEKNKLLQDALNGAYIIVDHSQDPCSFLTAKTLFLNELYQEFDRISIPKSQIILITPTPKELFFMGSEQKINYVSFNSLFEITKIYAKSINFNFYVPPKTPKKHFLCLMRRDSKNRRLTNYLLHHKNIHQYGIVSHLRITEGKELSKELLRDEINSMNKFQSFNYEDFTSFALQKHFIGFEYLENKGEAAHSYPLHQKLSQNILFEIISETDSQKNLFLSEKTFKAILNKNPFILLGNRFLLKYLRYLGFKTFHPVIDESYDSIPGNYKRFEKALSTAEDLCKLSLVDCEKKLSVLQEICEHNYNHFLNTDWHFNIHTQIEKIICNE